MIRSLTRVAVIVIAVATPAALPAQASADADSTLRQALLNLSNAPRITSTLSTEGSVKISGRQVINAQKRFVYEKVTENGRVTDHSVDTSRLAFDRLAKRRCWLKTRRKLNIAARFKNMKRKISAAEQVAPDVIAYTHDEEFGVFRVQMRYDPATLLPVEFNAEYIDDGQGAPGVRTYRITYAYTAGDKIPRHSPVCRR